METIKKVIIYTDGACKGNPGPGGFGAVLLYKDKRKELFKGYRWTTNNRMEILGLVEAVKALKEPCEIDVYSDSKYLLNALEKNWIRNWKRNDWKTSTKDPVQNKDLWQELEPLLALHKSTLHWVKGHATTVENNRCDVLAVAAATSKPLGIDAGYELVNPFRA